MPGKYFIWLFRINLLQNFYSIFVATGFTDVFEDRLVNEVAQNINLIRICDVSISQDTW